ncbi:putative protein kinase RLK-Pelle-DLSV family [Helianthus annuus]|uniref:Putative gnk2-like domain-containing protein n=1 Tax=Helianthus annuus TaxID=4232 RepID=A0A251SHC6_HELAN|nr:cysteine-rich receptor-like protein kinase 2 [Helianthus annuus]KAF5769135.1 putative protein kinase RLK-Pelle-DLSV family [Helianthus annuus]KAJ0485795.1 putative protein kinase RLK-Pelle-DLSV family [Helianthus annuus]KAJ0656348.1 putative protein kinase RLK-Pelle-DLSV family [Helianthus annuus]KAJ0853799.1 putative protein kinase RLK-Pelle-DLSV family [Helianthus annuus]
MSMKSWRLASLWVVVVVLITMAEQVTSQPTDRNSTLLRYYCSKYRGLNDKYFLSNLNTTLSGLRSQLTTSRYATARTLLNGESVWGLAWCRGYLSIPDCLSCFDYAVDQLKVCGFANGAQIIYSDCQLRYENNNFYSEGSNRPIVVLCANTTSPQPTEFRKAAEKLLSDLQIAAPRATNYYAASTRKVAAGNATVYAFAQCHQNISQSDCSKCLQLRTVYSCLPTTSGRSMDNGCFTRYDTTPFFGRNETTDISSLLWDGDSNEKKSIIGAVVGGVSFLLLLLAIFLWHRRSKKAGGGQQDKSTRSIDLLQGPAAYSYNDLKVATNNFSDENKLGGGMHGEVYKGTLENGDEVAIKKTFMTSSRGKKHFKDELKILGNVHHRHLLRLLGYCRKGPHLFLVHEYMENHSLDQFLYGDRTTTLSWKQRFGIIYGTARGLAYLHEQYHVTIIHRDIKTSNILLDNEFQPKIADFGLIRLLPEDKTRLSTELAGSLNSGYVAPEYAIHGHLSEKVDTYSYGVVVLEIVSGKRCKEGIHNKSDTPNLLDHAWNLYESGTHLNLVDDKLDPSEYATEDVIKIIEIALMCTQPTVSARPAMSEVVILLSDNTLEERPRVRSTTDDEVKIQVAMES